MITLLRTEGNSKLADRLRLPGSRGYPDDDCFRPLCGILGINVAVLEYDNTPPVMTIHGEQSNDPVSLVLRSHRVPDGSGHLSWHYDIIQHDHNEPIQYPAGSWNAQQAESAGYGIVAGVQYDPLPVDVTD